MFTNDLPIEGKYKSNINPLETEGGGGILQAEECNSRREIEVKLALKRGKMA